MTYTGYSFEEVLSHVDTQEGWMELLTASDLLVDGRFEIENRDISLRFRGSRNQRLLDVPRSLAAGKAVIFDLPG